MPEPYETFETWYLRTHPSVVSSLTLVSGDAHLACRTLKEALDAAVASPGDPAAVHTLMDPALARVDERTQFRGPSYFATLTEKLAAGDTEAVAAQFGPQGSCSRSLVIGSDEPPGS